VEALVGFARRTLVEAGALHVGIDFHGHNDRGLALANSLAAWRAGADRLHATALGIGERVGNAPMELLLVNLKLDGWLEGQDISPLTEYCERAAKLVGWPIPVNYPVVGADAFRTASGVHAAAILKAEVKGERWLADRVYSSIPADMLGREQQIEIGFMSGASNVQYWLRKRGIEARPELVTALLQEAKLADHNLTEQELMVLVEREGARRG
jgi:2-isopropylmalate synthase